MALPCKGFGSLQQFEALDVFQTKLDLKPDHSADGGSAMLRRAFKAHPLFPTCLQCGVRVKARAIGGTPRILSWKLAINGYQYFGFAGPQWDPAEPPQWEFGDSNLAAKPVALPKFPWLSDIEMVLEFGLQSAAIESVSIDLHLVALPV